jgi:hypothetical protein
MFGLGLSGVLDDYEVTAESISYPYPDGTMCLATQMFMDGGFDRMLIIDTDVIFEPRHVAMLLSHDVPFVAGLYPKKVRGLEFPMMPLNERDIPADIFSDDPKADPLVEVAAIARGFCLIKREVFEKVGSTWKNMPDGSSEDFELCGRMRAAGIKVLVDQRVTLKHEGSAVYPIPGTFEPDNEPWQQIHGWFDYSEVYRQIAGTLKDGSQFVEIGVWFGKSLAAMASYCKRKRVQCYAIDTFKGALNQPELVNIVKQHGGSIRTAFEENMRMCGVRNLQIIESESDVAAQQFADGQLDAAFIDADHSFEAVCADIDAWLPKIKPGGILAGHDANESGVKEAVALRLPSAKTVGRCWLYIKPMD